MLTGLCHCWTAVLAGGLIGSAARTEVGNYMPATS